MSAPTKPNFKLCPGANTDVDGLPPNNDVDPYGGAVNTAISLAASQPAFVRGLTVLATLQTKYGIAYIFLDATAPGGLANAFVYNRAGAQLNTSQGVCEIYSTSGQDEGKVRCVGMVGSAWQTTPEEKTIAGTTSVFTAAQWDALTFWRAEYLNSSGVPTTPFGDVYGAINGQICWVIWGTLSGIGATKIASAEWQMALASAIDTDIEGPDGRDVAPASGIGAFSRATKWNGGDASIAVPGGEIPNQSVVGVTAKLEVPAFIPPSKLGHVPFIPTPFGNPSAA